MNLTTYSKNKPKHTNIFKYIVQLIIKNNTKLNINRNMTLPVGGPNY